MFSLARLASLSTTASNAAVLTTRRRAPVAVAAYSNDTGNNSVRAFPQYNVFGQQCMLAIKLLPPTFRFYRNSNTLSVDSNKKGRFLVEWIPRNPDGTCAYNKNISCVSTIVS